MTGIASRNHGGRREAVRRAPGPPHAVSVGIPAVCVVAMLVVCRHDNPAAVGDLGLITVTPWPVYVIALVLTVGFVVELRREVLRPWSLGVYVFAITLVTHGIEALLEPEPRFPVAWLHAGITGVFLSYGHPLTSLDSRFSWPGFFTAAASIVGMSHIGTAARLIRWTPMVFNLMYAVPIYMIGREILRSSRRAWLLVWAFMLTNWVGQDYFSPQGLGYFLMLSVLAFVIVVFSDEGRALSRFPSRVRVLCLRLFRSVAPPDPPWSFGRQVGMLLVITVGLIALAMEHQLTPVVLIVDLIVLAILGLTTAPYLAAIAALVTIGWISYGAIGFWSGHLNLLFGSGGGSAIQANVSGHFTGSAGHRLVVDERVVFTLIVWLAVFVALVTALVRRRRISLAALMLASAPFPILLAQAYGGEASLRLYFYTLPFMLVLIVSEFPLRLKGLGRVSATALVVISMLLIPMLSVALYGNEQFEQARPSDIAAANYVYSVAVPGSLLVTFTGNAFLGFERLAEYRFGDLADSYASLTDYREVTVEHLLKHIPADSLGTYLLLTPAQTEYAIANYGFPEDWVEKLRKDLARSPHAHEIYAHAGAYVYRLTGVDGSGSITG